MRSIWRLAEVGFAAVAVGLSAPQGSLGAASDRPFLQSELVFPLEHWHNHASMLVEAPNGDLLVDWFHGSGERTADDVVIRGARLKKNSRTWSEPFLLADTPGYPDTNATMFIDPKQRLWLLWPTILANEWHTALMKYKISSDYQRDGPPRWDVSDVLHVTPGDEFKTITDRELDRLIRGVTLDDRRRDSVEKLRRDAGDKLTRRLGWMTRAHPYVLDGTRLIVPLYSDGFSFSLMAITDDWGATWKTSTPLVGFGNIQPSLVRKKDGTLVAYMRDNGPAPKRLHISRSRDRGETWSTVEDTMLPNPGSGAEVIALANGHWVLAYNDLEQGRWSLAVSLSVDEGATWPWMRHLERDSPSADPLQRGEYHYPSIVQAADGTLHASYSYFIPPAAAKKDGQGRVIRKAIKHAHFNEAWIRSQPDVPGQAPGGLDLRGAATVVGPERQAGRGGAASNIPDLPYKLVDWPTAPTSAAGVPGAWNFIQVASVAISPQGSVLVLHRGAHPVMEFESGGKFVRSWGDGIFSEGKVAAIPEAHWTDATSHYSAVYGPAGCTSCGAHSVRVDPQGNMWAVDAPGHVVYKMSPEWKEMMRLGTRGVPGTGPNNFNLPTDVAFASNGDVYVSDGYGSARVVKYSRDGKYLLQWGKRGKGPGEFGLPHNLVVDAQGRVYVTDRDNQRIEVFDPDGKFLTEWTGTGGISGLAITKDQRIWTGGILRDLEGKVLGRLPGPGTAGGHGVAVTDSGDVYIAQLSGVVQKFVRQ